MSHQATLWASQARGIDPAQKLILFFLADYHTADFGCEVDLSELSEETEIELDTLNDLLIDLERFDWIRLGADGRIWLSFEDGFRGLSPRGAAT